jgi:hypothetical protein
MSLRSKVKDWFTGGSAPEASPHATDVPSRHDRREAGRERHQRTGEPAWEAGDRVDEGSGTTSNPDAAPEILGR